MGSRGSSWVRWSWLDVGRRGWGGRGSPWVVLAHYKSIGFDGLAGLDSMVVVCGSVVSLGMNLSGFGYESQWFGYGGLVVTVV